MFFIYFRCSFFVNVINYYLSNTIKFHLGEPCRAYATAEEAVKDADIICTVTSTSTPVLKKEWVKPGCHINSVGAVKPKWQELESDLMRSSIVYVDSKEAACQETGDIIISQVRL